MTEAKSSAAVRVMAQCPSCEGLETPKGVSNHLPCFYCNGTGFVAAEHAAAIMDGARIQRWVRMTGMPVGYFARAFRMDGAQLSDVMFGRRAMPEDLRRGLEFFERNAASAFIRAFPQVVQAVEAVSPAPPEPQTLTIVEDCDD